MNLNIDKTKQLIDIFVKLNGENQDALLTQAFEMEVRQSITHNIQKAGKSITKENIDEAMGKFVDTVKPLMDVWDDIDSNHRAALAIMLNEMTNGELTKEEYIDFVVKSRQLSISEYIEKFIPGADVEEAKRIYKAIQVKT